VADMDDDNDLDVVATGWFADDVVWYENASAVEEEQGSNQPAVINLAQPFPNPFSKKTNIRYQITAHPASQSEAGDNSKARLKIYNATGRLVRQWDDATIRLSDHVIWDGTDNSGEKVSTGIYFVELTTTQNKQMRKLLIIR
ncbi:T9SS type A sorting domain-containing protein, partial [candidate division WOR-3 bacterium]|nr:T9SS type A sorting domain-containing protein [candidate division WOR-3 bacterium]